jgi:ParB-like chromosome segregation protein Spo0J
MKTDLIWHTAQLKINELIPFEGNPRQMTDQQAIQLKASLQKFNLVEIPAVNTNGKILAGHQRLKIMQLLGRGAEIIDVRVPNRLLTHEEEKEYLLRSNKNTGEWDWDELANIDESLLREVGFSDNDLKFGFGLGDDPEDEGSGTLESRITVKCLRTEVEAIRAKLKVALKGSKHVFVGREKIEEIQIV